MPRSHYPRQKFPMRIAGEAGRAWGQVWPGAGNLIRDGLESRTVQLVGHYADYVMPGAI